MADLTTFEEIRKFIPGLTRYMFCEARKHQLLSGRGAPVVSKSGPRCKIDLKELDHFLSFITSPYIIQDLPFGEKFLKLSSGEVVQTPNVIRVSVNERIISQKLQCCNESGRDPLSRSKLSRILFQLVLRQRGNLFKALITLCRKVVRPLMTSMN